MLNLYPKATGRVTQQLNSDLQNISDKNFRDAKDRICVFKELIPLLNFELDTQRCVQLLGSVLEGRVESEGTKVANEWSVLKAWGVLLKLFGARSSREGARVEDLVHRATQAARQISDSQFLNQVGQDEKEHAERFPQLVHLANKARQKASEYLVAIVPRTLEELTLAVHKTQEDECRERIKDEHRKRVNDEHNKLRVDLIKQVNNLSAQTASLYVSKPSLTKLMLLVGILCPSIM